mmetsp:Transcript_82018/g.228377  ORF Transcript_82018/g.228377 Transcript_82018/m.228377 type:complete len:247 (-) Transcript_82018:145-885(-)
MRRRLDAVLKLVGLRTVGRHRATQRPLRDADGRRHEQAHAHASSKVVRRTPVRALHVVPEVQPEHPGGDANGQHARHPEEDRGGLYHDAALFGPHLLEALLVLRDEAREADNGALHADEEVLARLVAGPVGRPASLALVAVLPAAGRGVGADAHIADRHRCQGAAKLDVESAQGVLQPSVELQLAPDQHHHAPEREDQDASHRVDPHVNHRRVQELLAIDARGRRDEGVRVLQRRQREGQQQGVHQ